MRRTVTGALLALSVAGIAHAHRLDEYLQATLIGVTPGGVDLEIHLTPGVAMLPVLMAIVDRNRDGEISPGEERAYTVRVLRELELRVDGVPAPLSVVEARFPRLDAMREGQGTIVLRLRTPRVGRRLRFENRHLPQVSVYLVNCLAAPDALVPERQVRDAAQRSIEVDYPYKDGAWPAAWLPLAAGLLLTLRMAAGLYRRRSVRPLFRTRPGLRSIQWRGPSARS